MSGIYRDVYILKRPECAIRDYYIRTDVDLSLIHISISFLGLWEQIHNPNFKPIEFDRFKAEYGDNEFTLTPVSYTHLNVIQYQIIKRGTGDIQCPTLISVYHSVCNPEIHRVLQELRNQFWTLYRCV